jgi:hypothetical protein
MTGTPYGRRLMPITTTSGGLMSKRAAFAAAAALAAVAAAGCGSSSSSSGSSSSSSNSPPATSSTSAANPNAPEVNPAGDIPDNQAYVRYAPPGGGFSVKVPEGWSRITSGGAVTFTDKLNAVRVETTAAHAPLTVTEARRALLPKLASSVNGFHAGTVSSVTRHAGTAVRIKYLAIAKANPVTGKTGQDAVERYVFFHNGRDVVLTLSGPKAADNVDPWRIISNSVAWSG